MGGCTLVSVLSDGTLGKKIRLGKLSLTIGRDPQRNDIRVYHPGVGYRHILLEQDSEAQTYVLYNLSSTHGTYLNGKPVLEPTRLKNSDVISLSNCKQFIFQKGNRQFPLHSEFCSESNLSGRSVQSPDKSSPKQSVQRRHSKKVGFHAFDVEAKILNTSPVSSSFTSRPSTPMVSSGHRVLASPIRTELKSRAKLMGRHLIMDLQSSRGSGGEKGKDSQHGCCQTLKQFGPEDMELLQKAIQRCFQDIKAGDYSEVEAQFSGLPEAHDLTFNDFEQCIYNSIESIDYTQLDSGILADLYEFLASGDIKRTMGFKRTLIKLFQTISCKKPEAIHVDDYFPNLVQFLLLVWNSNINEKSSEETHNRKVASCDDVKPDPCSHVQATSDVPNQVETETRSLSNEEEDRKALDGIRGSIKDLCIAEHSEQGTEEAEKDVMAGRRKTSTKKTAVSIPKRKSRATRSSNRENTAQGLFEPNEGISVKPKSRKAKSETRSSSRTSGKKTIQDTDVPVEPPTTPRRSTRLKTMR